MTANAVAKRSVSVAHQVFPIMGWAIIQPIFSKNCTRIKEILQFANECERTFTPSIYDLFEVFANNTNLTFLYKIEIKEF